MWIHQHTDWPHFTWGMASIATPLAALRYRLGRMQGRMSALGSDQREAAGLSTLTDDIVMSSAIEGEQLDPEQVRSSLARSLGIRLAQDKPAPRDVEGIIAMMLDATQNHAAPLTAERLKGWHASLFPNGHGGMRRITVGEWRPASAGAMQVVSGQYGRERVHFEAPEADRLEGEMQQFLDWFEGQDATDPVLRAAIAHFHFVTIHPFEDGNGRIARAIADMALARAEGSPERFVSMSAQIAAERPAYYRQLERQQRGTPDITGWLLWFIACLDRAVDRAEASAAAAMFSHKLWDRLNRAGINERQRKVVTRLLDGFKGHLTSSKYAKLAKCSQDTALRDITDLLAKGGLVQNPAGGRSTSYRLPSDDGLE